MANGRYVLEASDFELPARVCPGQHIADRSVFINTSSLLWAFRVSQEEGKPIDTLAFTNAANSHPLPYTATFTRRFDAVEEILNVEQVGLRVARTETELIGLISSV